MTNDKEPTAGGPDSALANAPEQNPYDTPMWRSIKKGTAVGFAVGFAIAQYIMTTQASDTPVGTFYEGNVLLVFAVWIGLGSAVGAGVGWFNARGAK